METLYLFNPENDMALACNDPYYMAPAGVRRMAAELSTLPAWYAEPEGTVWLDSFRRAEVLSRQLPLSLPINWTAERPPMFGKVAPWGWNPSLIRRLQEAEFPTEAYPSTEHMSCIRQLSGRHTAVRVLHELKKRLPETIPVVGEAFICTSAEEVEHFVLSHPHALLKVPWSGSGRGIQHTSGVFPPPLGGWVRHVLTTQHKVVGEPFYDRVVDFAMEFRANSSRQMHFVGYSLFETDCRGAYKENLLASDAAIETRLSAYVPTEALQCVCRTLQTILAEVIREDYQGFLGVDMMICRTADGYAIHPCVEINLRMNMGVVTRLLYDRYVYPDAQGRYVIEYDAKPGAMYRSHLAFQEKHPLCLEDGKIKSGYISLTPVEKDTAYQAYILVASSKERG
ncbi:hypothetical protein [Phocaeicola sp.]|uniref:hypothetical protein n=1 Tax=Phocaeicola sp. TaxID=2773926 RepID=UPI0023D6BDC6|nr:hypothetical protein [Phocaeicola sp.]MDE5678577.1 hypothetical protein [Phocaeicola sp.]